MNKGTTRNLYTSDGDVSFELKGFKDGAEVFKMDIVNVISFDIDNNDNDLVTLITINQYLREFKDENNKFIRYDSSDIYKIDQTDKLVLVIKIKGLEFYNNAVKLCSHKTALAVNEIAKLTLVFKSI